MMHTIFTQKTVKALVIISFMLIPALTQAQNFWEKVNLPDSGYIRDVLTDNNKNLFVAAGGLYVKKAGSSSFSVIKNESGFNMLFLWHDTLLVTSKTTAYRVNIDSLSITEYCEIPWGTMCILTTSNNSVLFGTTMYIIKSDNLTQPWDTVSPYDDMGNVFDFAEDSNGILYASSINYFGGICGVFQSVDGGNTWNNIGLNEHSVTSLALTKDNQILAGSLMDMYGNGGLYQYNKENMNWETLWYSSVPVTSLLIDTNNVIYAGNDWNNADTIGVRRSIDGGKNWEEINTGLEYPTIKIFLGKDGYLYNISQMNHLGKIWGGLYRSVEPIYVGINEQAKDPGNTLIVFPNPAKNTISIEFDKPESGYIEILDYSGREVFAKYIKTQKGLIVNINGLNKGYYMVTFTNQINQFYITRFIKQ